MSSKFAKDLKAALKEAIASKEGKLDLYSKYIEVTEPPAEYQPNMRAFRKTVDLLSPSRK